MHKFNKKVYIIGLIVMMVLAVGFFVFKMTASEPERFIESAIPESWTLFVEKNNVPVLWSGNPECKLIKLENPGEKYVDPDGGFEYSAWHKFWFCPKSWQGAEQSIPLEAQQYPARLLCDCDDFKIFHLSLGQNSQSDLPNKIKLKFKASTLEAGPQNQEWAINRVRALPEVAEYAEMLRIAGKKASFIAQDNADSWLVQVLEIVSSDDGSSHTATFGWYSVNKKTGEITKDF